MPPLSTIRTLHEQPTYGFGTAAPDDIKVVVEVLYFDNLGQGALVKLPLNTSNGTQ